MLFLELWRSRPVSAQIAMQSGEFPVGAAFQPLSHMAAFAEWLRLRFTVELRRRGGRKPRGQFTAFAPVPSPAVSVPGVLCAAPWSPQRDRVPESGGAATRC